MWTTEFRALLLLFTVHPLIHIQQTSSSSVVLDELYIDLRLVFDRLDLDGFWGFESIGIFQRMFLVA